MSLSNFDSLPSDLQQSWWLLCEFAFRALEKDQLVFSQEELEGFFSEGLASDERMLCFGLLQSVVSVGVGTSFHLTFQEYLAALYLARQPIHRQLEIFQSHISLKHHSVMLLRFFFGLNDFSSDIAIISAILQMLADKIPGFLYSTPLIFYHCAFESQNNLIIDEIIQFITSSSQNMIVFGHPHTAHDCAAILHVLANMQECDSEIVINFSDIGFNDNQINNLVDILACKSGNLQITELDLAGLTVYGLQTLEKAIHDDLLPSLTYLDLKGVFTYDAISNVKWVTAFVEALSAHCPNLKSLDFSNNNLGIPGMLAMLKIRDHHSTCSLALDNTNLGDEGLATLSENLEGCMVDLRLEGNGIHVSGLSCLADAVCSGKVKISHELVLSDNPLGLEGIMETGRMLSSSHCTLTDIELCNCKLTTAGGGLPNVNTNSLNPVSISLYCEAVGQQLCQLPHSTIGYIVLDGNSFTGEGIHVLAGFLHLCPHQTTLYTRDCGITSDDLIWLLNKLTQFKSSNPSLHSKLGVWFLQRNQIDDRGASALMDHLSTLFPRLGVHLHNNPVSSEMMKRLDEELKRHKQVSYFCTVPQCPG
jgi:hypothetical protein